MVELNWRNQLIIIVETKSLREFPESCQTNLWQWLGWPAMNAADLSDVRQERMIVRHSDVAILQDEAGVLCQLHRMWNVLVQVLLLDSVHVPCDILIDGKINYKSF